ncbi:PAS domain-containing protein [Thalassorhabdus alkalitolerans]|uniref:PAS domain-containing protein n=1 Tax=Thalassorhabdus alkalitolerans TaxID=2282697 RepID=A0ABW0YMB8_9BACI
MKSNLLQSLPTMELLTQAMDYTRVGVIITDPELPDNPIIYANKGFINVTGYSREEIIGKNCRFLQGEKTNPEKIKAMKEAIAQKISISIELYNYRKDGRGFWNELNIDPVYVEKEDKYYFVGVQKDITQEKEYRESLQTYLEEINMLSTPLVPILDHVYAMPLIGNVDKERFTMIHSTITQSIYESSIETLILDLSGLNSFDEDVISEIFSFHKLLNLLGTELIVTGITPRLALTSRKLNYDLTTLQTFGTIKDAIKERRR